MTLADLARSHAIRPSAVGGSPRTEPDSRVADFGGWVRDQMAEQRRSLRDVAWRASVDHSTVQRLTLGGCPRLDTASRVARSLGYELRLEKAA